MPYTAAQLTQYYTSVAGFGPDAATQTLIQVYANQNAAGTRSDASTLQLVLNSPQAQNTTDVAIATYQFFTGVAPSAAGLAYLRGDAGTTNTTGLNSTYYNGATGTASAPSAGGFNQENRYYNFSLSLAFGNAAANTNFVNSYGSLSFNQAITVAYEAIVGTPNVGAANAAAAISSIQSSFSFFQQIAQQRSGFGATATAAQLDLATKAVAIGYILEEAVKADVGTYAQAIDQFNASTAAGNNTPDAAAAGVNILTVFAPGGAGYGIGVNGGSTATGSAFVLTAAQDNIVGTTGPDTISAVVAAAGGTATTLGLGDAIDGGAGSDTLTITSNVLGGTTLSSLATIKNVETININNVAVAGAGLNVDTFDASTAPGVTTVNATGSGNITITNAASVGVLNTNSGTVAQTVTATGATTITASNNVDGVGGTLTVDLSGGASTTLALVGGTAAGAIDTLKLGTGTTTLNVNSGAGITVGALNDGAGANKLVTVNISGSGAANLGTITSTALKTVNASAETGAVTVALGAAPGVVYTGGSGTDTVTLAANTVITGTLDGGAGADILSISDTVAGADVSLTAATSKLITNFETLRVAATGAAVSFDASLVPSSVTAFQIAASTGAVTINNLAANATVGIVGNTVADTFNLKDATGKADVLNLSITGTATTGRTVAQITAPGVETLNISDTGGTGASLNTITKLTGDANLTKVALTGSGSLSLTTDNLLATTTIDGSAHTGSLTINAAATVGAFGVNVAGGSANDTITAGLGTAAATQTIVGNGGGDQITLGGAHAITDVIAYKAATDSLYDVTGTVGASATATANTGKMDNITNFISGQDKIDIRGLVSLSGTLNTLIDQGTSATTDALLTKATTAGFFTDISGQHGIVQAHVGADTYLFVDINKDGAFQVATDTVIKLTGTASIVQGDVLSGT